MRQQGCPPHDPHRLVAQRSLRFGKKTELAAAVAHGLACTAEFEGPFYVKCRLRQASIHLFLHSCPSRRMACQWADGHGRVSALVEAPAFFPFARPARCFQLSTSVYKIGSTWRTRSRFNEPRDRHNQSMRWRRKRTAPSAVAWGQRPLWSASAAASRSTIPQKPWRLPNR